MRKTRFQIPPNYKKEFQESTARLVRHRIKLLSGLIFILFWLSMILYFFMPDSGEQFTWWEIPFDVALLVIPFIGYFSAKHIKSEAALKTLAYFINGVLLVSFTVYYYLYPESFNAGCLYLIFIAFVIMMTMPWSAKEITVVFAGTTILFFAAAYAVETPFLNEAGYFEGNLLVLLFSGIVSAVFKHYDEMRRRAQFLMQKEVEEKNTIMEKELELAKQVHRSLIPKSFSNDKVNITVSYLPVFYVGGDYAKFEFLDRDRLLVFIMDITGHGVSAALLVNRLHSEISSLAHTMESPGELLKALDSFVQSAFKGTQKFLTACGCLLDLKKKKLFYSNFGHPPQILYQNRTKEIQKLNSQRHLLGMASSATEKMYETELDFEKGDRILLFTDGVLEVKGAGDEFFGEDRLIRFTKEHSDLNSESFNQRLLEKLDRYKSAAFNDDIFLMTIQIQP